MPRIHDECYGVYFRIGFLAAKDSSYSLAVFVLASSLFVPLMGIAGGILALLSNANKPVEGIQIAATLALLVGPLSLIPALAFYSEKVIARTPRECWPELIENARFIGETSRAAGLDRRPVE